MKSIQSDSNRCFLSKKKLNAFLYAIVKILQNANLNLNRKKIISRKKKEVKNATATLKLMIFTINI